jgi:hypothetical protein
MELTKDYIEKLKAKFNLTAEECNNIHLPLSLMIDEYQDKMDKVFLERGQTSIFIKEKRLTCGNLFTACLLFGKHVPSNILKYGQKCHTFEDGFRIQKKGEFYYLSRYIFCENENRQEFIQWANECNEHELLKNKTIFDFETLNPGVPFGSIQIEKNKEYSGSVDGSFTIKTIDDKIWVIPGTSSFDLHECSEIS